MQVCRTNASVVRQRYTIISGIYRPAGRFEDLILSLTQEKEEEEEFIRQVSKTITITTKKYTDRLPGGGKNPSVLAAYDKSQII